MAKKNEPTHVETPTETPATAEAPAPEAAPSEEVVRLREELAVTRAARVDLFDGASLEIARLNAELEARDATIARLTAELDDATAPAVPPVLDFDEPAEAPVAGPRASFVACDSIVIAGPRRKLLPGDAFEASPEHLAGLTEGTHYTRS